MIEIVDLEKHQINNLFPSLSILGKNSFRQLLIRSKKLTIKSYNMYETFAQESTSKAASFSPMLTKLNFFKCIFSFVASNSRLTTSTGVLYTYRYIYIYI